MNYFKTEVINQIKLIIDLLQKIKKDFLVDEKYLINFLQILKDKKDFKEFHRIYGLEKSLKQAINNQLLTLKEIVESNICLGNKAFLIASNCYSLLTNLFNLFNFLEVIREKKLDEEYKFMEKNTWEQKIIEFPLLNKFRDIRNIINHNFSYNHNEVKEVFWEIYSEEFHLRFGSYKLKDDETDLVFFEEIYNFSPNPEFLLLLEYIKKELTRQIKE